MSRNSIGQFSGSQYENNTRDRRFGRLVAISPAGFRRREPMWLCRCDCGNDKVVGAYALHRPNGTRSCGCLQKEKTATRSRTHGLSSTPEYKIWGQIKKRCYDPSNNRYTEYGGRGIRMCDRWIGSFEAFYADMGPRPSPKHSIDRERVEGDYEPGNCRWATPKDQARNKRNNVAIEFRGETKILEDWAREFGIHRRTLKDRLVSGMSMEEAVSRPVGTVKKTLKYIEYCGVLMYLKQWADTLGVPYQAIQRPARAGRPPQDVIRDILRRKRESIEHVHF